MGGLGRALVGLERVWEEARKGTSNGGEEWGGEERVISTYPLPQSGMGMRGMRRSYREGDKVLRARAVGGGVLYQRITLTN